jgi:hypothetical protein
MKKPSTTWKELRERKVTLENQMASEMST